MKNIPIVDEQEDRIVGGDEVTDISQRPFQIAFEFADIGFQFCGGSIIDDYTVLTAAHCCVGQDAREVVVRAGALKVGKHADGKVSTGCTVLNIYFWKGSRIIGNYEKSRKKFS